MKHKNIILIFGLIIIFLGIFLLIKNFGNPNNSIPTQNQEIDFGEFYENYEENFIPENLNFSLEGEIEVKYDLYGQKFYEKNIFPGEIGEITTKTLISEKIYEDNGKISEFITPDGKIFSESEFIDDNFIISQNQIPNEN